MPPKKRERSPSSTPIPSTEGQTGANLPDKEWQSMSKVLNFIYDYRSEDGFDPSKLFHRLVNKRIIPEYYDTIKEPMAMSTVKAKINKKLYRSFAEFVRDFALIPHNAQVFNRSDSGAFQDALVIRDQLRKQLQLLVEEGVITKEIAELPDLGEIPTFEEAPPEELEGEGEDEEESDEDAEDEEEDEQEVDDEGRPVKKKRRGRPPGSKTKKNADGDAGDDDGKRARGRPPKLLTPTEARILAVLKGIRKPKNLKGQLMIRDFDRLPDKQSMPEYYTEIKNPMAYDALKKKVKRKKYATLEAFMSEVNLMFNNAKQYNQDDSQIYKNAVTLQIEAGRLYDNEMAKPDESFADEDGKLPMPNGIFHNGELYKVGDWIHIQNINDLTKPIPAQIYRTYKDPKGVSMVNVCWYYRPEQTVHRFDKHFLANEVVKTGRYKDHRIDEVESKCFIMFYTRYFKGRPRNLPEGMEIYVCRDRYNEDRHQFNTIKTWASCLPDEVRDKDYEMDLFDHTKQLKKHPSPLAYMLKDEQKEADDFPKVTWGADGAPPKIGAVHRRPRQEKDSPPPEPTPPPQPKIEPPTPRPIPQAAPTYQRSVLAAPQQIGRPPSASISSTPSSYQPSYTPQALANTAPSRPPSTQTSSYPPATPQTQPQPRPQPSSTYQQPPASMPHQPQYPPRPNPPQNYRDPPPIEVYTLPDAANLSIPTEVRDQYQRDEFGRVLFFTTPPVSTASGTTSTLTGHSVRYRAEKSRRAQELAQKRKERDLQMQMEERAAKKTKVDANRMTGEAIETLKKRALGVLESQLAGSINGDLGESELGRLSIVQQAAQQRKEAMRVNEMRRLESRQVRLDGERFADDWDNRLS